MRQYEESRRGEHPERPSGYVCFLADGSEDVPALLHRQAQRLAGRYRLTPALARVVAELAYSTNGRRA